MIQNSSNAFGKPALAGLQHVQKSVNFGGTVHTGAQTAGHHDGKDFWHVFVLNRARENPIHKLLIRSNRKPLEVIQTMPKIDVFSDEGCRMNCWQSQS